MLVAEPARVPPGGTVTLVIHNRRDERLGYGLAYTLERWDGHAWTAVPTQGWKGPALLVEPGGVSAPQEIPVPPTDGWYRVTKTVQAAAESAEDIVGHARLEVAAALLQPRPGEDFVVLAAAAATHAGAPGPSTPWRCPLTLRTP
ncbi:MAG: immunoglobulin-like domain-containing protein [Egibacteraceae bacterium]